MDRREEKRGLARPSKALLKLAIIYVIRDGAEVELPTADVVAGDSVVIRSGNRIPVDGIVEIAFPLAAT